MLQGLMGQIEQRFVDCIKEVVLGVEHVVQRCQGTTGRRRNAPGSRIGDAVFGNHLDRRFNEILPA